MTAAAALISRRSRAVQVVARADLWTTFASLTLGFALLDGLGAFESIYSLTPTKYSIGMTGLLASTILLTPRGMRRKVVYPKPVIAFVAWIGASYTWTSYHGGFVKIAWRDVITLFAVLVVGQLFTFDRFLRVVLHTGYVAIGLVLFTAVAMHSRAFTNEGLRGGFIHKSPMGAALILTVVTALCLDVPRTTRRVLTGLVVILLLLGRTTTGIASILLVLGLYVPLVHYNALRRALGRAFGVLISGAVLIFSVSYYLASNALVSLYGKDLTFSNRTLIWQGVVDAIGRHPLTGYGWSVWEALWLPPASNVIKTAGFAIAESHNTALELLLRLGVIGLGLYLWLLVSAVRTGLRLISEGDRRGMFGVLLGAIIVIWGFSESLAVGGAWVGLLGAAAVYRSKAPPPERARRRRFLAPTVAHAR